MGFHLKQKHMIDFLFPIALFFVFALSALTLVLFAARIYRSTTENSSLQYTSRTGLSYISEKIHQNDGNGTIALGSFDGCDALIMDQFYGEEVYHTYIYAYRHAYGQELKELFIKDGVAASAADGRTILEIQDFSIEQLSENLFQFDCTDAKNQASSTIVGIRSRQGM